MKNKTRADLFKSGLKKSMIYFMKKEKKAFFDFNLKNQI